MPNGKPGDAPWTDFFIHKHDVYPKDISEMLWAIYNKSPDLLSHLSHPDMWDWEQGKNLDEAREKLKVIIHENEIPHEN